MQNTQFGRLTVLCEIERKVYFLKNGRRTTCRQMRCLCTCGKTADVALSNLKSGRQKSCGCLHDEAAKLSQRTHGMSKTPIYQIWSAMRRRCYNKNVTDYPWYGGRGIKVCESWDNFENFLRDMGPRPEGFTLDRIDPDADYSPENCRWADWSTQKINQRRTVFYERDGRRLCLKEWAEELGLSRENLRLDIQRRGLSFEQAVQKRLAMK